MVTDDYEPDERFWALLIEAGVLDEAFVEEHKRVNAGRTWRPIGEILLAHGHLTREQFVELLNLQVKEPHLRFGALAVREGFCSEEVVEEAQVIQREKHPGLIPLLLRDRRVDGSKLAFALVRYINHLQGRVHCLAD